jgi:hypothetical protein
LKRSSKARSTAFSAWLERRVAEAFADPRANLSARQAFARLRQHHAKQAKAGRHAKKA